MLTEDKIKDIMKQSVVNADVDSMPIDAGFSDYGLDSLDIFNVIIELQELTGIEVPDEDVENLQSIQSLMQYFVNKP